MGIARGARLPFRAPDRAPEGQVGEKDTNPQHEVKSAGFYVFPSDGAEVPAIRDPIEAVLA
jgi:hypothetical protein